MGFALYIPLGQTNQLFAGAAEATTSDQNSIAVLKLDGDQLKQILAR